MIDPTSASFLGHCRWCGAEVSTTSFRTPEGLRAYYTQAAACQRCRDLHEFGRDDSNPSVSYRVRHGVVVSAICEEDCIRELALVPFLFVVGRSSPGPSPIIWDPSFILRAGPAVDPVDPWVELGAMAEAWSDHFVRVVHIPFFTDPLLRAGLVGRDLVIGLDSTSARAVATLVPNVRWPALVGLSSEVPWEEFFGGFPLLPLGPFFLAHALEGVVGTADACRGSALRQIALIARLLALRPAGRDRGTGRDCGHSAFELLLSAHSARFEESLRGDRHDLS